uniref:Uncharacterized protein n=1 Tax=Panagrolaimus superbus TaxID=310955 RepID=A0A914Z954_9BILA
MLKIVVVFYVLNADDAPDVAQLESASSLLDITAKYSRKRKSTSFGSIFESANPENDPIVKGVSNVTPSSTAAEFPCGTPRLPPHTPAPKTDSHHPSKTSVIHVTPVSPSSTPKSRSNKYKKLS